MQIKEITIKGFRCFDDDGATITLSEKNTCFVGNNGSGKTAVLLALQKLFGEGRNDRIITRDDFYLAPGETLENVTDKKIMIEVVFIFPKLQSQDCTSKAVPFFPCIYCSEHNNICKLRIRLEAQWDSQKDEDDVESQSYYIITDNVVDFGDMESVQKIKLPLHESKKIRFHYMPAFRNAQSILRNDIKKLVRILKNYVVISDDFKDSLTEKSKELNQEMRSIAGIKSTEKIIQEIWQQTHDNTLKHFQETKFSTTPLEITQLLEVIYLTVAPDEAGEMREISELSDGQISLLYITLVIAIQKLLKAIDNENIDGFNTLEYLLPDFLIFGFEEPESHLSPYYIGKVLDTLSRETNDNNSTIIVTTHSPAVIRRLEKIEDVRHFRQESDDKKRITKIETVGLQEDKSTDDYKYINQAVLNHPELYFAKLVILGEGDSEAIIIPQLAKKMGFDLDPSFVAFVKLGGKHVNHMWRLLDNLKIPYLTLLDLDYGRYGGGMDRIKDISKQLDNVEPTDNIQQDLHTLEQSNVFFSYPLDLDMTMLQSFPEAYDASNARLDDRETLKKAVLGKSYNPTAYENSQDGIADIADVVFQSYRYLFKSKSKVVAHYQAIAKIIEQDNIEQKCPESIRRMIEKATQLMKGN